MLIKKIKIKELKVKRFVKFYILKCSLAFSIFF